MGDCRVGLDQTEVVRARLAGCRVGLLAHGASLDRHYRPIEAVLAQIDGLDLRRRFAPEHGRDGAQPAGEHVTDAGEGDGGVETVSLYGVRRSPDTAHLADLDALVIDLADAGVRCFTYLASMLACVTAAAGRCPVVVLDRPNPLGRVVEGRGVHPGDTSIVAPMDIPFRHGLTLGELACLFAAEQGLAAPEVIAAIGWFGGLWPGQPWPGPAWVSPSPNLPGFETALVYPATVFVEGLSLSEGRGTAHPFRWIGAPGFDPEPVVAAIRAAHGGTVLAWPVAFTPTAGKHAGRRCGGVGLAVADPGRYRALDLTRTLFVALAAEGWAEPVLDAHLTALAGGHPVAELAEGTGVDRWRDRTAPIRLYGDVKG